jgi:hypothetical protein
MAIEQSILRVNAFGLCLFGRAAGRRHNTGVGISPSGFGDRKAVARMGLSRRCKDGDRISPEAAVPAQGNRTVDLVWVVHHFVAFNSKSL